jgi:hypothetical protein
VTRSGAGLIDTFAVRRFFEYRLSGEWWGRAEDERDFWHSSEATQGEGGLPRAGNETCVEEGLSAGDRGGFVLGQPMLTQLAAGVFEQGQNAAPRQRPRFGLSQPSGQETGDRVVSE